MWAAYPLLGLAFLVPALSLAGIPPLSGFWGKLVVIRSGLEAEAWLLAGVALAVGLLTLYSMVKIWNEAFWKAAPEAAEPPAEWSHAQRVATFAPIVALCLVTLTIGLWTEPFAAFSLAGRREPARPRRLHRGGARPAGHAARGDRAMRLAVAWLRVGATFVAELAKSTVATVRAVLGPTERLRPAILAVPLDVRSPAGTVLFADMVTLTPGTTSLEVSADGRTLYVHVLDAPDRDAAIAGMKSTLEARAREVLP
jgi:multisubunit Na+/H+ antiporter MnhE subunit